MKIQRSLPLSLAALALLGATLAAASAAPPSALDAVGRQDPPKKERDVSQYNLGKHELALEGFDPVAYFPEGGGEALKGLAENELVYEGVRYYFASEKNLELFKKHPARFEPHYGGWCAYAMADGKKVEIDPKSFHVEDGKLFVFYKSFINDTRKKWLRNPVELERKADKAWGAILHKKE